MAKETKAMLDAANIDDWLLSFLLCSWTDIEMENKDVDLIFPKDFSLLQKVVLTHNRRESLQEYLSCWYRETADVTKRIRAARRYIMGIGVLKPGLLQKY